MSTTVYDRLDPAYRHSVLDAFVAERARRRSMAFVLFAGGAAAAAMAGVSVDYDAVELMWALQIPVAALVIGHGFKHRPKGDPMGVALAGLGLSDDDRSQLLDELNDHPDFEELRERARVQSIEQSKAMHKELRRSARRA